PRPTGTHEDHVDAGPHRRRHARPRTLGTRAGPVGAGPGRNGTASRSGDGCGGAHPGRTGPAVEPGPGLVGRGRPEILPAARPAARPVRAPRTGPRRTGPGPRVPGVPGTSVATAAPGRIPGHAGEGVQAEGAPALSPPA